MNWLESPLRIADFGLIDIAEIQKGNFNIERSLAKKVQLGFNAEHFLDDVYGNGLMSCVNTPWREWTYRYIHKFAQLGADGVFLDGPVFHPKGCYCTYCQKKFKNRYGKDLPRKGDLTAPDHKLLVEFQEDSVSDYMKGAYQACKRANPKTVIYMNGEPLRPSWASGRNNRKLEPYQDLVGAEGGFIYGKLKHLQLFERIFDSLIQREIILENTPRSVEVSLREKGDRLFVHLINFSCELKRPIESVIPLQDIVVKIPEIRAAKVRPLIEKNQISWQVEDGFLKVTLPLLKEYEILEIWRERK